jgi:hypothetical protein
MRGKAMMRTKAYVFEVSPDFVRLRIGDDLNAKPDGWVAMSMTLCGAREFRDGLTRAIILAELAGEAPQANLIVDKSPAVEPRRPLREPGLGKSHA